jgi:hypothetical protein
VSNRLQLELQRFAGSIFLSFGHANAVIVEHLLLLPLAMFLLTF